MSGRTLAILALAAAIAAVAAWYVRRPPEPPASAAESGPFLPGLAERLPDVDSVRVRVAGGRLLARVERDGDTWKIVNRHGYPADPATVRGTLIALAEARRVAPKTDRPEGWSRLGVGPVESPDAVGVELLLGGLDPPPRIIVGKAAAGDAKGTYLRRVEPGERAWLVSEVIDRPDEIADWLDDTLVDIAPRRLRAVRLEPRDGDPVVIDRGDSGRSDLRVANRPEGRRPLSPSIARSIARIVTALELVDVHPAESVDALPVLSTARFTTFGGLTVTIEARARERGAGPRHVRLEAAAADTAPEAIREEVQRINARVDGWRYELPEYKFVNLAQTLEGVLEPPRGD